MKLLATIALLGALTACTGCESAPVAVTSMQKPTSLSFFKVRDNITILFPDGSTLNGVVTQVGEMQDFFTMPGGPIERSRAYAVRVMKTQQVTGPSGEPIYMQVMLEGVFPEFAMKLIKQ